MFTVFMLHPGDQSTVCTCAQCPGPGLNTAAESRVLTSAANEPSVSTIDYHNHGERPLLWTLLC